MIFFNFNIFSKFQKIIFTLSLMCSLSTPNNAQLIDWTTETGLNMGDTFVDGQVINNFAGSGLNVRINVNVVNVYPRIHPSDVNGVHIADADGASFTLTILNGTSNLSLDNQQNTLDGEMITLSNPDGENITITEISNNGGGAMTVDGVNMPTGGSPNAIIGDDNIVIQEQNAGAGTMWTATMDDVTSFTWLYNAVTGTSAAEGFKLTLNNIVLPIELDHFQLTPFSEKQIKINWTTNSETNNDFFTIERSSDGFDWNEIGKIDGQGTSSTRTYYEYFDHDPLNHLSYYRLRQTDLDGNFSYSTVKSISIRSNNPVKIFPNPFDNFMILSNVETSTNEIFIMDAAGKVLNNLIQFTIMDDTTYKLELSRLPRGIYFLKTPTTFHKIIK